MFLSSSTMTDFACPQCHQGLVESDDAQTCPKCHAIFRKRNGLTDFAPEIGRQPGLGQRFMEAPAVARIYEGFFRPMFTRLGSSISYQEEEAWLAQWFRPKDGIVLDLACGTGRYAAALSDQVGAERVVGLDLSSAMLERARWNLAERGHGKVRLARASALALPFQSAALGAVNCFGALHLFPDPSRAISEIGRVLAPGGTFTCLTAGASRSGFGRAVQAAFSAAASFQFFETGFLSGTLENAGLRPLDFTGRQMVLMFAAERSSSPGT